jgi:hypothetical protein
MKVKVSFYWYALVLAAAFAVGVGCSKAPNDAQITSDIQSKLHADSGLQGKQLGVQAANGAVTLSGTVDNDAEREAAARYASSVAGVKQVVNNLQVATASAPVSDDTSQTAPPARSERHKPSPSGTRHTANHKSAYQSESGSSSTPAPATTASAAPPPQTAAPVAPPAPAPPPPPQKVTIASGTTLAVRLVDALDSETATQGQTFHATLNSPLSVEGDVAIPAGYDVEGHVVAVQSAGKFRSEELLTLQLDRISVGGKSYSIQTDQYHKEGSSRGKNTAEKVGAGAAIGAIIGAVAGGGKGAAIGAAAGGGLGGGVQAATKSQQIKLPPETVLNFTLQAPLTVVQTKGPNEGRPKLDPNQ